MDTYSSNVKKLISYNRDKKIKGTFICYHMTLLSKFSTIENFSKLHQGLFNAVKTANIDSNYILHENVLCDFYYKYVFFVNLMRKICLFVTNKIDNCTKNTHGYIVNSLDNIIKFNLDNDSIEQCRFIDEWLNILLYGICRITSETELDAFFVNLFVLIDKFDLLQTVESMKNQCEKVVANKFNVLGKIECQRSCEMIEFVHNKLDEWINLLSMVGKIPPEQFEPCKKFMDKKIQMLFFKKSVHCSKIKHIVKHTDYCSDYKGNQYIYKICNMKDVRDWYEFLVELKNDVVGKSKLEMVLAEMNNEFGKILFGIGGESSIEVIKKQRIIKYLEFFDNIFFIAAEYCGLGSEIDFSFDSNQV